MKAQHSITLIASLTGRYAVIAKVSNKAAELVGQAIIEALRPFDARATTLTYDIGKGFCRHALIDEALKSTGYFARPFANTEFRSYVDLGFCQSFNGLLRQYVPKTRPIKSIN